MEKSTCNLVWKTKVCQLGLPFFPWTQVTQDFFSITTLNWLGSSFDIHILVEGVVVWILQRFLHWICFCLSNSLSSCNRSLWSSSTCIQLGLSLRVDSNGPRVQHGLAIGEHGIGTGVGGTPYDGVYGEVLPERSIFFRLLEYERVGISLDEVYKRASALIAALAASVAVLKEKKN